MERTRELNSSSPTSFRAGSLNSRPGTGTNVATAPDLSGSVKVYNRSLVQEMLKGTERNDPISMSNTQGRSTRSTNYTPNGASPAITKKKVLEQKKKLDEEKIKERYEAQKLEYAKLREDAEKKQAKKAAEQLAKREQAFHELWNSLISDLDFVQEIQNWLDLTEKSNHAKKEALYLKWKEKVYDKIMGQISEQIDSRSSKEIEDRRRELFNRFLEASNSKDGLFLDIIIEHDYNPTTWKSEVIRYDKKEIHDPIKDDMVKMAGDDLDGSLRVNKITNKPRDSFDVSWWDKVEATPHGRYANMFKEGNTPEARPTAQSSITFDHFNIAKGKEATDAEIPKGKRTFPGWRPGQLSAQLAKQIQMLKRRQEMGAKLAAQQAAAAEAEE